MVQEIIFGRWRVTFTLRNVVYLWDCGNVRGFQRDALQLYHLWSHIYQIFMLMILLWNMYFIHLFIFVYWYLIVFLVYKDFKFSIWEDDLSKVRNKNSINSDHRLIGSLLLYGSRALIFWDRRKKGIQ